MPSSVPGTEVGLLKGWLHLCAASRSRLQGPRPLGSPSHSPHLSYLLSEASYRPRAAGGGGEFRALRATAPELAMGGPPAVDARAGTRPADSGLRRGRSKATYEPPTGGMLGLRRPLRSSQGLGRGSKSSSLGTGFPAEPQGC